jgi:hypothetical protein
MLKIKDNVDLKELEKYGFEIEYDTKTGKPYLVYQYWGYPYCDPVKKPFIWFVKKGRKKFCFKTDRKLDCFELYFDLPRNNFNIKIFFDTLYDLIQAGLIEKV